MSDLKHLNKEMNILVVDDFASMRQVIRKTLLDMGFKNIQEAAGAVDAVRKIKEGEHFEFIISDWNMPEMSGLEFLTFIRGLESMKGVPFLMITAEAQRDNIIQAAKAGVSQYIIKPFSAEALQSKLENIFCKNR